MEMACYLLPEHLLTFFAYDDRTSLNDDDEAILDRFIEDMEEHHGHFRFLTSDEFSRDFVRYHDLVGYGWKTDSCVVMTFDVAKT
jgi:hypothetical protein